MRGSSRSTRPAIVALLGVTVGGAWATGCGDLQFRQDHRVAFTAPADFSDLSTPVTLRWSVRDFGLTGLDGSRDPGRGIFGVFVDQAPIKAGAGLRSVAGGDESCLRTPGCPDAAYLAARGVYTTTDPTVTLQQLPRTTPAGPDRHRVTVVLLDGTGSRIGESAWQRDFRLTNPVGGSG